MTAEELHTEYWAWVYHENPNYQGDEDTDFDIEAIKREMAENENWVPE